MTAVVIGKHVCYVVVNAKQQYLGKPICEGVHCDLGGGGGGNIEYPKTPNLGVAGVVVQK